MANWDPEQYLRFEDQRARPFADLLSRIPMSAPRSVVDLGCGPGNTTAQLAERWPEARILGLDSSEEMIRRAKEHEIPGRLEFVQQDLREWVEQEPVDVLLCCATLQWVPGHVSLFPRFVGALSAPGAFAFQVPGNFGEPSHTLLHALARSDRWAALLGHLVGPPPVLEPEAYLAALLAAGADPDVWETTYLHVLEGPDAVLQWIKGTGLRPYLSALEESGRLGDSDEFLDTYRDALRTAYRRDEQGRTVFPFRRIFGVASRGGPGWAEPGDR